MVLLGLLLPTLGVGISLSIWLVFIAIKPFKVKKPADYVAFCTVSGVQHSTKPDRHRSGTLTFSGQPARSPMQVICLPSLYGRLIKSFPSLSSDCRVRLASGNISAVLVT